MPTLLDFRRRIRSVKNTQQITRAMKFVAAARLRRAQEAALAARPYAKELARMLRSIMSRIEQPEHPLLDPRHNGAQHAGELLGVRAGGQGRFLGAPQSGGRDELHRAGDLLGVLHRADAAAEIEKCGHRRSLRLRPQTAAAATPAVKRSLKPSTAVLISALMPSSRAFFAAIFFSTEG